MVSIIQLMGVCRFQGRCGNLILLCSCDPFFQNSLLPHCFLRPHSSISPSIIVGTGALTDRFDRCRRKDWSSLEEERLLLFIPNDRYILIILLPMLLAILANHAKCNHSCSAHWETVLKDSNCHEPIRVSLRPLHLKSCRYLKLKINKT